MQLRRTGLIPTLTRALGLAAFAVLIAAPSLAQTPDPDGPAPSLAPSSDGDCILPRDERSRKLLGGDDPPVDANRLSDPEVFDCLLKTAEKGGSRYALEWAEILLWEGKIGGQGYGGGGT